MIEDIRYSAKINWIVLLIFLVLMCVMLFYLDRVWADQKDPKAVSIAQESIKAMGGLDTWKQVAAIRFDFVVSSQGAAPRGAKHLWDRKNARDHVEGKKDNKAMVAWVDLRNKTGAAWLEGKKLDGQELAKALEWAYGRWVNDTYWMIMPLKMLDPGVNLKYEGAKDAHEILRLSFNAVGLTPGDQYWAYINKTNHLMEQWEYVLEDKDKGSWSWKNWTSIGPMKLSTEKISADKKVTISLSPLKILDSADPAYFAENLKTLD